MGVDSGVERGGGGGIVVVILVWIVEKVDRVRGELSGVKVEVERVGGDGRLGMKAGCFIS